METRKDVKTVQVDFKCPKCNVGFLRPTGVVYSTYPAKFPHKCNHCDYNETFTDKQYPYMDFVDVDTIELELWVVKYGYPESDTNPNQKSIYFSTFALSANEAKSKAFQNKTFLELINFRNFNKELIVVYRPDDKEKQLLKIDDTIMR
jgi:hypothetical protein